MSEELDRTPAILADIARFAASARRVVERGYERFADPDDDDQRRIARSLVVDLSAAADRLPEAFRQVHPDVDWRGIRAVRNFIAHDYDGTDDDVLWQALVTQFPAIVEALDAPAHEHDEVARAYPGLYRGFDIDAERDGWQRQR